MPDMALIHTPTANDSCPPKQQKPSQDRSRSRSRSKSLGFPAPGCILASTNPEIYGEILICGWFLYLDHQPTWYSISDRCHWVCGNSLCGVSAKRSIESTNCWPAQRISLYILHGDLWLRVKTGPPKSGCEHPNSLTAMLTFCIIFLKFSR